MHPIFIHIDTANGLWASCDKDDTPANTLVTFRVNSGTALVNFGKLTGSGNASASALAVSASVATGKQTEITKTK